jgi:hypothetical protein
MTIELTVEELKTIVEGLIAGAEASHFMEDFTRYNMLEAKIESLLNN